MYREVDEIDRTQNDIKVSRWTYLDADISKMMSISVDGPNPPRIGVVCDSSFPIPVDPL